MCVRDVASGAWLSAVWRVYGCSACYMSCVLSVELYGVVGRLP